MRALWNPARRLTLPSSIITARWNHSLQTDKAINDGDSFPTAVLGPGGQQKKTQYGVLEDAANVLRVPPLQGYNARPIRVEWTEGGLTLSDDTQGGRSRTFQPAQLRDSCTCPQCRDASSGQKSFATIDIPTNVAIRDVVTPQLEGDSLLHITLENGPPSQQGLTHVVTMPHDRIHALLRGPRTETARAATRRRFGQVHWDATTIPQLASPQCAIDYADYMQPDSPAFWSVVRDLVRYGLVFLKNVPAEQSSVSDIASRIAHVRPTFYGSTFDVRAKPAAENVAYTSGYLGLHQDLLYLEPPPHIQILHCLENSCAGGDSLFSDGDRIARMLWHLSRRRQDGTHPHHHTLAAKLAASLATVKVPYAYDRNGHRYRRERTMLAADDQVGSDGNRFGNYFWSPPFQGLFDRPEDLDSWIPAARVFEEVVNSPDALFQTRLGPGDAVLFDNLRVMHGRTAFDVEGGGSRWLRGTYIDGQDFFSTASHAPLTHAVAVDDEVGGWKEEAHMDELVSSIWYQDLVKRLENAGR